MTYSFHIRSDEQTSKHGGFFICLPKLVFVKSSIMIVVYNYRLNC